MTEFGREVRFAAPYVPPAILAEIEKHARSQIRPERECVGYLTVENGIAVKYTKLRNWGKGDYHFRVNHLYYPAGRVLVHSHPDGSPYPSTADLKGANRRWLERPYAIISVPPKTRFNLNGGGEARLHFFLLHADRKDWTEIQ